MDRNVPTTKTFNTCPKCGRMPELEAGKERYWWVCRCGWRQKAFPVGGRMADKVRALKH